MAIIAAEIKTIGKPCKNFGIGTVSSLSRTPARRTIARVNPSAALKAYHTDSEGSLHLERAIFQANVSLWNTTD
jgi:hypothetical protein